MTETQIEHSTRRQYRSGIWDLGSGRTWNAAREDIDMRSDYDIGRTWNNTAREDIDMRSDYDIGRT